ncbi:arylsulfatase [Pseudoramibacter alactolyticus ATCC 23263]|uniref:Arylsulfatase n=1 Tax=Pseudoramibacter alactolyticus ATCC 23263 TaxID=887929 RepID=E6MGD9_9FIRM|nr:LTA synthase family protein [Pseudoramibacter alactolyticus]EFV01679.1 arylsulfatase [Pseudoramibacter alactolyticus ATCC 23263]
MKQFWVKIGKIAFYVLTTLIWMVAMISYRATDWLNKTFGVKIEQIIFTVTSPMKGANTHFFSRAVIFCLPQIIAAAAVAVVLIVLDFRVLSKIEVKLTRPFGRHKMRINLIYVYRLLLIVGAVILLSGAWQYLDRSLGITQYARKANQRTKIYEKYYVDPNRTSISTDGKTKKNVIYIYMESMETTYASQIAGGAQPYANYIPNLTALANENVSFSDGNQLGGFHNTTGTGWTMGSLFAQTSGVPYALPTNGNSMNERKTFASGITSLGDILQKKGYNQEFLCGSDSSFAGRNTYFKDHGKYAIFDLKTAKKRGYIPKDYHVWWGYEDAKLYEYAKIEATALAGKNKPFNLTMLTADTHFPHGYLCQNCYRRYGSQAADAVDCADRQVYDFVNWAKQQSWYPNTVIVIVGDHPRMDNDLVAGISYYDRTVYNCIINGARDTEEPLNLKNRVFTPMDMLPTTLASMGYRIKGNRLGLGANLFSNQKTLAETLGFDQFNKELAKKSTYYMRHFY